MPGHSSAVKWMWVGQAQLYPAFSVPSQWWGCGGGYIDLMATPIHLHISQLLSCYDSSLG